jgi:acetyl-CoA carboxylase carboxyl transferase subunit alpha
LYQFGIIDGIISEPPGGAHNDFEYVAGRVKDAINSDLRELMTLPLDDLLKRRYQKFRNI